MRLFGSIKCYLDEKEKYSDCKGVPSSKGPFAPWNHMFKLPYYFFAFFVLFCFNGAIMLALKSPHEKLKIQDLRTREVKNSSHLEVSSFHVGKV